MVKEVKELVQLEIVLGTEPVSQATNVSLKLDTFVNEAPEASS